MKNKWLRIKYRLLLLIAYMERLQEIDKARKARQKNSIL